MNSNKYSEQFCSVILWNIDSSLDMMFLVPIYWHSTFTFGFQNKEWKNFTDAMKSQKIQKIFVFILVTKPTKPNNSPYCSKALLLAD